MGVTAGILGAVATLSSAGIGAASAGGAFGGRGGGGGGGATPALPTPAAPDTSAMAKSILPSTTANAAARAGGGISPDFLSNLVDQGTGVPSSSIDILGDIRKSLGQS